jgi:hypothetical protein
MRGVPVVDTAIRALQLSAAVNLHVLLICGVRHA